MTAHPRWTELLGSTNGPDIEAVENLSREKDPDDLPAVIEAWLNEDAVTATAAHKVLLAYGAIALPELNAVYEMHIESGRTHLGKRLDEMVAFLANTMKEGGDDQHALRQQPLPGSDENRITTYILADIIQQETDTLQTAAIEALALQRPRSEAAARILQQVRANSANFNSLRFAAAVALRDWPEPDSLRTLSGLLLEGLPSRIGEIEAHPRELERASACFFIETVKKLRSHHGTKAIPALLTVMLHGERDDTVLLAAARALGAPGPDGELSLWGQFKKECAAGNPTRPLEEAVFALTNAGSPTLRFWDTLSEIETVRMECEASPSLAPVAHECRDTQQRFATVLGTLYAVIRGRALATVA